MAARKQPVKYTVPAYLQMLEAGNRSPATIRGYRKVFQMYAKHLGITIDEVHQYINVENLLKFAGSRKGFSPDGRKTALSVLRRYAIINGIQFDELELNVMKPKVQKEHHDKPLTLKMLQGMMDLTDAHGKALLTFLVSTGVRAGELTQLTLSDIGMLDGERFVPDITGDVINVRNEIAKGGHGGYVFLTAEAREYLTLWLRERNEYLAIADARMKGLVRAGAHHRQDKDNRIFGVAYTSLHKWFTRLYEKVDGEHGKYHNACTIHSCRKYFRTTGAKAMHPDLVTCLMRQTGYLDSTYVRKPAQEKENEFHRGEAALFLTRADHRIQSGKISQLEQELAETKAKVRASEQLDRMQTMTPDLIDAVARRMLELQRKK